MSRNTAIDKIEETAYSEEDDYDDLNEDEAIRIISDLEGQISKRRGTIV
jgi:hypothetical protein